MRPAAIAKSPTWSCPVAGSITRPFLIRSFILFFQKEPPRATNQRATVSAVTRLYKQGPRNRLRRAAGAAPPRGAVNHTQWGAWGFIHANRGRGTGFAGPQAQRPLGGQRSTRSDKRGDHTLPATILMTAMRTAMPKVTCGKITLCAPSTTAESISTPRLMGPGCMTMASDLAS
jgi:hypothetical protein